MLQQLLFGQKRAVVMTSRHARGRRLLRLRRRTRGRHGRPLPPPSVPLRLPAAGAPLRSTERAGPAGRRGSSSRPSKRSAPCSTRVAGRAFLLFTSFANLHAVRRALSGTLPYPMLVQGDAPRTELLERFRDTDGGVLLATSSFWEGVDVVGDRLSLVVVDKLPFAVPGDPLVSARIDLVTSQGGNAFADYQVPMAILSLKQGARAADPLHRRPGCGRRAGTAASRGWATERGSSPVCLPID